MNDNRTNKIIAVVIRFLVVIFLLGIAIFLFQTAPYFKPVERFSKGVIRVVVDDRDVTNYLPDPVYIKDDVVMMSSRTAMKYFDNIYVYYDKKYDTTIVTSARMVGKMKTGENTLQVNGESQTIKGSTVFSGDILFLPISSIQEVTDVDVIYNEKVITTTPRGKSRTKIAQALNNHKLKAYQRELALTTGVAKTGELMYVFDTEGKADEDYLKVRDARGNIGYYQYGKIDAIPLVYNQGKDFYRYQFGYDDIKYVLTWEYAQNYTPNRTNETKIGALDIISPTWMEVNSNSGDLKLTVDSSYIEWAKEQNYRLWPTLKNDFLSMSDMSTIMNDMYLREKLIQNVVQVATQYGFEGVNVDFENMYREDKDVFSEFVRELAATLRSRELISSVDVTVAGGSDNYSLCYDRTEIGKAVDYVMLMAYDQYGDWSPKAGPVASLAWVEENIKEMLEIEKVDKDKLFLCIPFYSRHWIVDTETGAKVSSSAINMKRANEYLKQYQSSAVWSEEDGQYYIEEERGNGTTMKLWIENEEAMKEKIKLVNEYDLAGVATWRWGFEDGNTAWQVIDDTMDVQ